MHYPRWYPDLTELADGRFVAISGNTTDASHWADTPEVYDPTTNTWTVLSDVNTSQVHEEEYPFSYLVPNGNVFTIGPSEDKSFLLNVPNQTWTPVGGSSGVVNGSSVMYRPGQILYSGGTQHAGQQLAGQGELGGDRPELADPDVAADGADGPRPDLPHADDAAPTAPCWRWAASRPWGQTGKTEVSGGVLPSEIWDPNIEDVVARRRRPASRAATTRPRC